MTAGVGKETSRRTAEEERSDFGLRRGAGQQLSHVIMWHSDEEFLAQNPQGVWLKVKKK